MQYHTSWDWLMPVVEKIDDLGFSYEIATQICSIGVFRKDYNKTVKSDIEPTISVVWQSVIEFITWYKTKTTNTTKI